jgi:GMP synthase (glutamine-hydrolysing)
MQAKSDSSSTVLMIVHQATSTTGRIGRQLEARGYVQDRRCPNTGCSLPKDVSGYAGVVVFGGPMSANDDNTLPCIRHELEWIEQVLHADVPYLGVCLGAQLLARAHGAKVTEHPQGAAEIGYYPVRATQAGAGVFEEELVAYQWHREGFDLPSEAVLLAEGDLFTNQAFSLGRRRFGLQFHPEVTRDVMLRWLKGGVRRLTLPGTQQPETQRVNNIRHDAAMERWLDKFLDHWLVAQ